MPPKKNQALFKDMYDFLGKHIRSSNDKYTHTAIGDYKKKISGGSYTISEEKRKLFLDLYHKHTFIDKKNSYLTEGHEKYGPFLIDLDFRFALDIKDRQYNNQHIEKIMKKYTEQIVKYLDIDESKITAFIM